MESGDEPVLRFISVDKSKEKYLQRASEASKEYELDSEWIPACDLRDVDLEARRSVFVLENFEGEDFEYLKENKCRVVGPQCILSCLQTKTSLPNVQYAVYSIAMRGTAVSCTSVPKQERDRLYELIQLMGGIVMKDFTSSVTHLVAGEVGSKKYRVACSFNKPILLPQWVYKCWELCRDKHICATDEEFMEYLCPIFKGITLCVTGIDAEKRKEIKKIGLCIFTKSKYCSSSYFSKLQRQATSELSFPSFRTSLRFSENLTCMKMKNQVTWNIF